MRLGRKKIKKKQGRPHAELRQPASRALLIAAGSLESLVAVPTYCGTVKPGAVTEPLHSARGRPAADNRQLQGAWQRGSEGCCSGRRCEA